MPGTQYSPLQIPSPQYDPVALNTYFEISRGLKDAYPADYNSLGKLWDVIKSALRGASSLPGWPGLLATGASTVASLVDGITSGREAPALVHVPLRKAKPRRVTTVIKEVPVLPRNPQRQKTQRRGGGKRGGKNPR